jgi:hypothetical protein
VFQQDESDASTAAAPAAPVAEPVVTSKPKKAVPATDVSDVLKEWTKK